MLYVTQKSGDDPRFRDYGLPGLGLVVYHVRFNLYYWYANIVNNEQDEPNYSLVAADRRTYTDWYNWIIESGLRNPYLDSQRRLNSRILSGAPYPWVDEDTSVDQVMLFDEKQMTDITQHEDGTVSFTFHTSGSGIRNVRTEPQATGVYTLTGQKLRDDGQTEMLPRGIYIVNGQKIIKR